jgi:hypothetical protein
MSPRILQVLEMIRLDVVFVCDCHAMFACDWFSCVHTGTLFMVATTACIHAWFACIIVIPVSRSGAYYVQIHTSIRYVLLTGNAGKESGKRRWACLSPLNAIVIQHPSPPPKSPSSNSSCNLHTRSLVHCYPRSAFASPTYSLIYMSTLTQHACNAINWFAVQFFCTHTCKVKVLYADTDTCKYIHKQAHTDTWIHINTYKCTHIHILLHVHIQRKITYTYVRDLLAYYYLHAF